MRIRRLRRDSCIRGTPSQPECACPLNPCCRTARAPITGLRGAWRRDRVEDARRQSWPGNQEERTMTHYGNQDMGSVEAQLVSLYGEREHLERELGVSEAAEIVSMVRSLEAQLRDLYYHREHSGQKEGESTPNSSVEMQLVDLYEQRERLQKHLGCSDSTEIIDMVGSLEHQLQDLYRDRESGVGEAARVVAQIQGIARELGGTATGSELTYAAEPSGARWQITWKTR